MGDDDRVLTHLRVTALLTGERAALDSDGAA